MLVPRMLQLFYWFRVVGAWVEMLLRSSSGTYKKLRVIGTLKLPFCLQKHPEDMVNGLSIRGEP